MIPRRFGDTGIEVSPIALGTVKLGRDRGVKYPRPFHLPDDREAARLLGKARDLGINLLDTAPAYGTSEERLGRLLQSQREQWLISTKVGEEFDPATGRSRFDYSETAVRMSVERSLRRIGTDRLDVVLVHSDGNDLEIIQNTKVLMTLSQLKNEGKIRAVGFSGKTARGGLLALDRCDCVMVTYNRAYPDERAVLDKAKALDRGVLIKKPFASGHLVGEGPGSVERSLRFIFGHAAVHSVVIGTIDPDHLAANVEAFGVATA